MRPFLNLFSGGIEELSFCRSCHDFQAFNLHHRPEFSEYVDDTFCFGFKRYILILFIAILPDYRRILLGSQPKLKLPTLCVLFPRLNPGVTKLTQALFRYFTFSTPDYPPATYCTPGSRLPPLPASLRHRFETIQTWSLPISAVCTPNNPRGDGKIERKSCQTQGAICNRAFACTIWSINPSTFAWTCRAVRPPSQYACCRSSDDEWNGRPCAPWSRRRADDRWWGITSAAATTMADDDEQCEPFEA